MRFLPSNYDRSWAPFFQKEELLLTSIDTKLFALSKEKAIYPHKNQIFKAFSFTPLDEVKVVILGQDPYHGFGEAHGLLFSVPEGVKTPPSLRNIFKELKSDCGITRISTDLSDWAQQGVFLLNTILTVEEKSPGAHKDIGWEQFTDSVITTLSEQERPILFVLWGNFARKKKRLIDQTKHTILEGVHPSPLSAYRGFFGSKPFSAIAQWLEETYAYSIEWGE